MTRDVRIEAAAKSDAAFDGRNFLTMGRVDRERYFERAKMALEAADRAARHDGLADALRPFVEFARNNVDENGWTNCQNDRICDWFGPSEFRALASYDQGKSVDSPKQEEAAR